MALDKCCFCCKLENGVIFLGIYTVLVNVGIFCAVYYSSSDTATSCIIQICAMLEILMSILLMLAGVMRNHLIMVPWIAVNGIALLALVPILILLICSAILISFPVYLWWCMCSAYQKFQSNDDDDSTTTSVPLPRLDYEDLFIRESGTHFRHLNAMIRDNMY